MVDLIVSDLPSGVQHPRELAGGMILTGFAGDVIVGFQVSSDLELKSRIRHCRL